MMCPHRCSDETEHHPLCPWNDTGSRVQAVPRMTHKEATDEPLWMMHERMGYPEMAAEARREAGL